MATILVVDDLTANRKILAAHLRYEGYQVLEAGDGQEALAAVQAGQPDLIITDVLMPLMDGYELVRQLRLHPATCAIPVVFHTVHYGAREARALALSFGRSYVLTKPAEHAEVMKVVLLALSGESGAAESSLAPAPAAELDREHLRLLTGQGSDTAAELRTANARLRALLNIGLELASDADADHLLERVCVAGRDLFGATYLTLGILHPADRTVARLLTGGTSDACHVGPAHWLTTGDAVPGILATVVSARRTMRGENPGGDPATLHLPGGHPEVHAYVAAPIASPAQVYGWICLIRNEGAPFTEDDEQLVMALAAQVGRIYESLYLSALAHKRAEELAREVVERQQAVEALRVAEERIRFALEVARVGIWDMDYTTGTLRWSESLEAQHGLEPGRFDGTWEAFIKTLHPDDRAPVLEVLTNAGEGSDFSVHYRVIWADGTVHWLAGSGRILTDARGEPVRGIGISQDVTGHRMLEEQYLQSQKMEAVGRLAAGVAHDFNNLLTVILGTSELLLADLNPADSRHADIAGIQRAGDRAAALTNQLLAFSRKQIIEPALLDLSLVVAAIRPMIERLIEADVAIVLELPPGPVCAVADRGQVEQILMNLAVNARDAMPAGGTLTIRTANVELEEQGAATDPPVKPGSYVALTVADTGTGITPEVRARLFEPFFTTKEPGKGTGLGLATVHSIVTRSGGSVGIASEPGAGAAFTVYFPRADAVENLAEAAPSVARESAASETVLVVEDQKGLGELVRRILQREGYTVLLAADADQALQLFEQNASIDLLLTDVVMPGASGPELTRQLTARRPALKVIYMSGYTEDAIIHHGVLNPGIALLHKPFTADALGRKVREALDRSVAIKAAAS